MLTYVACDYNLKTCDKVDVMKGILQYSKGRIYITQTNNIR